MTNNELITGTNLSAGEFRKNLRKNPYNESTETILHRITGAITAYEKIINEKQKSIKINESMGTLIDNYDIMEVTSLLQKLNMFKEYRDELKQSIH